MKKFFTILLSLVIIIAGFGVVIAFDSVKAKINQTEILVAAKDISFKEKITKEHLAVAEIPKTQVLENAYTPDQAEEVIGSFAAINIVQGQQIHDILLDSFDLIPNEKEGEFIAPIPEQWLFAVPQSLRKSYLADFYVIPTDEKKMIESMTSGERDSFIRNQRKPILKNVRISSVKSSSNTEVETVISENNTESTTGTISNIEIIATDEILNVLRQATDNGYTLYVVYTVQREGNEDREVIIDDTEIHESSKVEGKEKEEANEENQTESEDE